MWWAVGWIGLGIVVTALMWQMRPQALRNAERIYVEDETIAPDSEPAPAY